MSSVRNGNGKFKIIYIFYLIELKKNSFLFNFNCSSESSKCKNSWILKGGTCKCRNNNKKAKLNLCN